MGECKPLLLGDIVIANTAAGGAYGTKVRRCRLTLSNLS